ncbi:2-hydroxyacid dehydrogenase family protein [Neobacillus sp. MER 74]|uniref:2-hydroxyacid dehydrogenase family protein n=1 Tax=Neobacillus sp. MER 74 TaxID=2939566 RepID=UPI00203C0280|nr:2-hydroxyacid dehydrogenase family protein [Neobacillus sp. MER 74]MCM3115019.1 2-hydroxyacid dehydrogenase family protein [Neobacillus sp. MER 74]
MARVLVAGEIPQKGLEMLLEHHEVEVFSGEKLISDTELKERIKDKDALLSLLSTPVTKEVIDQAPDLKIIANYGAGFNNIDFEYAASKGVPVTNTPMASTAATADLTIALLLASARRVAEGDDVCRTVGFNGWAPLYFLGREVTGKTIGIIGFGQIGQAVAKRAAAFDMKVLYTGPNRKSQEIEQALNATYVSFDELVAESDFITINCSYNPTLKHMFSTKQFEMMKSTAYLINCARGPIVDEEALVQALSEKQIEGAGIDVFEFEPEISDGLKKLKNVVLTPHIGNATYEARDAMAIMAASNIVKVLNGEAPLYVINGVTKETILV